ncbi:MAG: FAD-dependent oxidoreductase [Proteobacteria bacterium]|nr:FAD-dependent oxidoreductase [Pseudomonadota bacterium]
MSQRPRVKVVGAGISGLSAAYFLLEKGFDVEVFESEDRVGGLIKTTKLNEGLVESAANAFISSALLESIAQKISCELVPTLKVARKRFIYVNSKPRRWPLSFFETIGFILRLPFIKFRKPFPGETVKDWGERSLGAAATSKLIAPALQGIYAGDITRMSATLIFGRYFTKENVQQKAPVKNRGSVSPLNGMSSFVNGLKTYLISQGVKIHESDKVSSSQLKQWSGETPVVVATSLPASADLMKDIEPKFSEELSKMEMLPLLSCTAFFKEKNVNLKGFGVLFHPSEKFNSLGMLFNHSIFPNRSHLRSETWILKSRETDYSKIKDLVLEDHFKLHGFKEEAIEFLVNSWPKALPHYTLELEKFIHSDRINFLEKKNIYLTGNYLGHLGLSRIIEANRKLAERISQQ